MAAEEKILTRIPLKKRNLSKNLNLVVVTGKVQDTGPSELHDIPGYLDLTQKLNL
jgi:hypothetical protein